MGVSFFIISMNKKNTTIARIIKKRLPDFLQVKDLL